MIMLIAFVLISGGCSLGAETPDAAPKAPSFTAEDYPAVDGSTVTIPLSEALGAKLMGIPVEEARQYIVHNKTHQAYINLIDGAADLIFVTSPSEDELQYAKDSNIELEIIPVVSEGFVFLANKDNPVDNLTIQQVRDCLLYTSPSPRDGLLSRMPSSA